MTKLATGNQLPKLGFYLEVRLHKDLNDVYFVIRGSVCGCVHTNLWMHNAAAGGLKRSEQTPSRLERSIIKNNNLLVVHSCLYVCRYATV